MEIFYMMFAGFVVLFGGLFCEKCLTFGFLVADKALENSVKLLKLPFVVVLKLISSLGKLIFKQLKKQRTEEVHITPIFNVTPVELQHMRNKNLTVQQYRQPVTIEHPPLNKQ